MTGSDAQHPTLQSPSSALEDRLRRLEDRVEIQRLFATYARGVDRKDESLIRSVYHPDAIDNHGSFNGSATSFVDQLAPRLWHMDVCFHGMCQPWIEIEGDIAVSETYFIGCVRLPFPDGLVRELHQLGRYVDRIERRQRVWKIAHRQLLIDYTRISDAVDASSIPDAFRKYMVGAPAPSDFAYERWAELQAPA